MRSNKDFYHTGLECSRSDVRYLLGNNDPRYVDLHVNKGSAVASPAKGVYEAGADGNDGLTWGTAFATIAQAITIARGYVNWSATPWAPNVRIHIAPGLYNEHLTAMPHGCSIIGHGEAFDADGETGVKIRPTASLYAADQAVYVGGWVNGQIHNVCFETQAAVAVFYVGVLNNVRLTHCRFAGPPEATTATSGIYTNDSVMLKIDDCIFNYVDCGIDFVYADGGDSCTRLSVKNSEFVYISEAGIRWSANLVTPACTVGPNNVIHGGGTTLAIGIDDNSGQNNIGVFGNFINATDDIQGLTTNVGGNYIGGSSVE